MLIACAGIGIQTSAPTWNAADFESIIQVNLIGVANSIAAVMPGMIQRRRAIWSPYPAWHRYRGIPSSGRLLRQQGRGERAHGFAALRLTRVRGQCDHDLSRLHPNADDDATRTGSGVPMLSLDDAVEKMVRAIRSRKAFVAFPRQGGLATTRHESFAALAGGSIAAFGQPEAACAGKCDQVSGEW